MGSPEIGSAFARRGKNGIVGGLEVLGQDGNGGIVGNWVKQG